MPPNETKSAQLSADSAAENEGETLNPRPNILIPAQLLQTGEIIVLMIKPSPLFILLAPLPTLVILAVLTVLAVYLHRMFPLGLAESQIVLLGSVFIALRIFWQFMEWLSRVYVLTDRRIVRVQGVFRISVFEAPLQKIQHSNLYFSLRERVFALGSILFATAGTAAHEIAWTMINQPLEVHQKITETINRYKH